MTNEENKDLEQAVEEALKTPIPAPVPDIKPYLHQTSGARGLKGNTFPLGQKSKPSNLPKLDASGEVLKLSNGGDILVKDLSGIKFWHEGKLISKAEHDELTNGIK
jgi:hypothetical protein